jgi:uncharacterized protein (TIRG00374 family)
VPRRRATRLALVWGGILVSAAFTYLAIRDVDPGEFWRSLRDSNYWWLVPSFAVLAVGVFLRAIRWRMLFRPARRPPLGPVTSALLIGYLFNNILPARAGEAIRVVALNQRAGTSRVEAVGTVVTERVYDVFALLLMLFVSIPWLPEVTWVRRAAVLGIVLAGLLALTIAALAIWEDRPVRFLLRPLARLPGLSVERTEQAAANLVEGLAAFRHPLIALPAFAVTIASWLVIAVSYWLVTFAFDLGLGFGAGLLVLVATNLAMVIPSSPGALGVFEAAVLVALRAYGIDKSEALSYAIVLHAVNFFPYLAVGYAVLHRHVRLVRRSPAADAQGAGSSA